MEGFAYSELRSNPKEWERLLGLACQLFFAFCWVGGLLSIPVMLAAAFFQWWSWVAIYFVLVVLPYVIDALTLRKGVPSFRDFICYYMPLAHPGSGMHSEEKLDESVPTVRVYHPHGILSWSLSLNWGMYYAKKKAGRNFPGGKTLVAGALAHAPLARLFFALMGQESVGSASQDSMKMCMKREESFFLVSGGFHEATLACPGKERVYLKKRKGFIKYALQYGYSLTPSYGFGENDLYWNFQGFISLRHWLNNFSIATIMPFGRPWCPILPRGSAVHLVFGKPLQLPKIDQPSKDDVDEWHKKYIDHLTAFFDRQKGKFGATGRKLEVW